MIGNDTIIYPGVMLQGKTRIGSDCIIGMNSSITNSEIGDGTEIKLTIIDSKVGENSTVGPYAYLRPKSDLEIMSKNRRFCSKNAIIEDGSKASPFLYRRCTCR